MPSIKRYSVTKVKIIRTFKVILGNAGRNAAVTPLLGVTLPGRNARASAVLPAIRRSADALGPPASAARPITPETGRLVPKLRRVISARSSGVNPRPVPRSLPAGDLADPLLSVGVIPERQPAPGIVADPPRAGYRGFGLPPRGARGRVPPSWSATVGSMLPATASR